MHNAKIPYEKNNVIEIRFHALIAILAIALIIFDAYVSINRSSSALFYMVLVKGRASNQANHLMKPLLTIVCFKSNVTFLQMLSYNNEK